MTATLHLTTTDGPALTILLAAGDRLEAYSVRGRGFINLLHGTGIAAATLPLLEDAEPDLADRVYRRLSGLVAQGRRIDLDRLIAAEEAELNRVAGDLEVTTAPAGWLELGPDGEEVRGPAPIPDELNRAAGVTATLGDPATLATPLDALAEYVNLKLGAGAILTVYRLANEDGDLELGDLTDDLLEALTAATGNISPPIARRLLNLNDALRKALR